jgi:hypothetical protein
VIVKVNLKAAMLALGGFIRRDAQTLVTEFRFRNPQTLHSDRLSPIQRPTAELPSHFSATSFV